MIRTIQQYFLNRFWKVFQVLSHDVIVLNRFQNIGFE